jgi:hypothetical protein
MHLRIAVLLTAVSLTPQAQRGAIAPGRAFQPGHPAPGLTERSGWSQFANRYKRPGFGPAGFSWFVTPSFGMPVADQPLPPETLFYSFPDMGVSAPSPNALAPAITPTSLPAQTYTSDPDTSPIGKALPLAAAKPPRAGSGAENSPGNQSPSGSHAELYSYQPPIPDPVIQDEYPPIVVLRTGGVYSVVRYWFKRGKVYFITPQGEYLFAPIAALDRVYPRLNHGHVVPERE